jgi:hypothetical protein
MAEYVYLIEQANSPYCKIGVSNNPSGRLWQLQHKNPDRLYVRFLLEVKTRADAHKLESLLHQQYSGVRRYGEWFILKAEQVVTMPALSDEMLELIVKIKEYPQWVIETKPRKTRVKVNNAPPKAYDPKSEISFKLFLFFLACLWLSTPLFMASILQKTDMHIVEIVCCGVMSIVSLIGMIVVPIEQYRYTLSDEYFEIHKDEIRYALKQKRLA